MNAAHHQNVTDYTDYIRPDDAGRNKLWLAVGGMHCAGCAAKIERTLNNQKDVEARVNVTEKRLSLVWHGDKGKGNDLIAQAEKLGFQFSPLQLAAAEDERDNKQLMRCLAVAGFAAGNIMIFSLAVWFTPPEDMGRATRDLMHWFSALIALPAAFYAGRPFFSSAWKALSRGQTNMDVPISVGVILTLAISLFETMQHGPHVYFDSALMLLFLLLAGRYLDAKARGHAKNAATNLLSLMGGTATILENGETRRLPAQDIAQGATLLVAKGERILADGILESAGTLVDSAAISGETLPRTLVSGDPVFAGMVNLGNPVTVHVTKAQHESLMNDVIRLMQKAEQGNAAYVRLADRVSRYYTPVVHLLAAGTFIAWVMWGGMAWQPALMIAVTVLIITCPCALGLAVPVVQVIASQRLFRHGMLLKSADALERIAQIDTIVFDKTGTLTTGNLRLINAGDFSDDDMQTIRAMAASSHHPLARAVLTAAPRPVTPLMVVELEGKGLETTQDGKILRLGSAAFTGGVRQDSDAHNELWFRVADAPARRLVFSDSLHADAIETIAALKKKYQILMLSGDREETAAAVAMQAGIDTFIANIDPKKKFDIIDNLAAQGKRVLMVGDGLNDAPALTRAFASMSPASALHIAQNAADIVWQGNGIGAVSAALETAIRTQKLVRQNFALAIGYNFVAVPLAMAGFITPLIAAAAMSTSSLIVTLNAFRLRGGEKVSSWIF